MWIKFIKDYKIWTAGEKADVTRAKAAELLADGYISADLQTHGYDPPTRHPPKSPIKRQYKKSKNSSSKIK